MTKFAPGLKIMMYYALTEQKKKNVVKHLRDFDVVITTPHIKMPEPIVQNVKFHRLVIDEAHLLDWSGAGTMGGKVDSLLRYQVRRTCLRAAQSSLRGLTCHGAIPGGQPPYTRRKMSGWRRARRRCRRSRTVGHRSS